MTDGAFWRFSIGFYAAPEVQAACLALQDELGADVNMVLFMLFQASLEQRLDADQVAAVEAGVAGWRDAVVRPLRQIRRELKGGPHALPAETQESLRDEVKRLELRAEQLQQAYMETEAPDGDPARPAAAARANLAAYAVLIGADPEHPAFTCLLTRFAASADAAHPSTSSG